MGDLDQVALIEKPRLDYPLLHELADLRAFQGSDPIDVLEILQLRDLFVGNHSPVAHQDEPLDAKLPSHLPQLR